MASLLPHIRIPIPPPVLTAAVAIVPLIITIFGTTQQVTDYVFSGSLLRAANVLPSCCDSYDFIVVGGGSAGSAVAARLSENFRVLLLEAGGDPNPISYIPATLVYLSNHPSVDWQHKTVSQNGSALGGINQVVPWPRGKSLGGSSNSNFMIYMRGNPKDFDRWATHTNDSRWEYKNVEKYFKRYEDYFGHWESNGHHSKGGPLRIEKIRYHPGLNYVMDAAREMGYEIRDPNSEQKQGFAPLDLTQKKGLRFSTYRAYIRPNLGRKNLVIYRYTLVTRIHFDNHRRAVGVTYLRHGVKGYASATKEIIVCGGTVNSPQLLMLSGIGPQEHLLDVGINPIVDLPSVGENLQDHVSTAIGPFLLNKPESFMLQRDITVGAISDFIKHGIGPLTTPGGLIANGVVSTRHQDPEWPNIMYTVSALGLFKMLPSILDQAFYTGKLAQEFLSPDIGKDNHVVLVTLGLPKSKGNVRLKSRNPLARPLIDPKYYSDSKGSDIKEMVEAVKLIVKLYENTTSLQKLGAHLPQRKLKNCERFVFKSDEYYECHIRTVTLTLYHPSSTCRMGRLEDTSSVVDSQLRVKGVKGLRVADASIMPYVTNANTNAPSIMIGEMCADIVKRTWGIQT